MRKPLLFTVFIYLLLLVFLTIQPVSAAVPDETDYRLGVGDALRVRVFEWRSATGDVHQWDALKGEYDIGADGSVGIPLIGSIKAAGLTTGQLADEISSELQSRLKLSIRPQA